MRRSAGILFSSAVAFALIAAPAARDLVAEESPPASPLPFRAPGGLPPLFGSMRVSTSFIEAPPFDEDAQAFARLCASRDPAVVELVRLMNERDRRLAAMRERRAATTDAMAILALQREAQRIKLDFDRGWMVAQRDRARVHGRDATATELERQIVQLDRRRAVLEARLAAPPRNR